MVDLQELYNKINYNHHNDNIIFNYIKANNIKYTKNTNGIFFNLKILRDDQLNELKIIIDNYTSINKCYDKNLTTIKEIINTPFIHDESETIIYKYIDEFTRAEKNIIKLSKIY